MEHFESDQIARTSIIGCVVLERVARLIFNYLLCRSCVLGVGKNSNKIRFVNPNVTGDIVNPLCFSIAYYVLRSGVIENPKTFPPPMTSPVAPKRIVVRS